jgi:penicillin-binding protein 2
MHGTRGWTRASSRGALWALPHPVFSGSLRNAPDVKRLFFHPFCLLAAILPAALSAQELAAPQLVKVPAEANPLDLEPSSRSASDGSILTRRDARTITLKIPAPRGQITDREGKPLAQNQVAYQVALQFRQFENVDRDFIVHWGRTRLDGLQAHIKNSVSKTDDELYEHYRHRRWLPLLVSGQMGEKEARALEPKLSAGLILHPVYRRYYPGGDLACHILGYTGIAAKLPTGPINFNEPLWEESEGRAGFEAIYNRQLTGEPGTKRLLFDENGRKLLEEQTKRPRPGGTVVTTLNHKWQKLAEDVLKKGCQRGAFVVLDVVTGEVLVMASRPSFDLNGFIPGISGEEYKALEEDASKPLVARAFQGVYPPASTYKPIIALAALNNGVVNEHSKIYSGTAMQIGNHTFRNWSKTAEGAIDVKRAIARSTNTWFYQVGINTGPSAFLNLSKRLGMGETTGLPLQGERPGLVPDDEYMQRVHKRRMLNGDTANMSIGQGSLLATPLQVAQAMAGIANGGALPKLQLIRQVQDSRGRVTLAPVPERRHWLGVDSHAVEVVRQGMYDVVNSGGGTGRSAALTYTTLAGKTGTAQWGPPRLNQRLAWFAGFLPHDDPRFAFAVLYEGRPGETVSGGRMAAPMVKNFFEPLKDEIKEIIAPPQRALIVGAENPDEDPPETEDAGDEADGPRPPKALPVDDLEVVPLGTEPEGEVMPLPALPVEPLQMIERVPGVPPPVEVVPQALPVEEDYFQDEDEEP